MRRFSTLLCLALVLFVLSAAVSANTTLTYQGHLEQADVPAGGTVDMQFRLFDAASGGTELGNQSISNVQLHEGHFQVPLDFGAVFDDGERWLEVQVDGVTLSPRQKISATPVALYALAGNEGPQGPPGAGR